MLGGVSSSSKELKIIRRVVERVAINMVHHMAVWNFSVKVLKNRSVQKRDAFFPKLAACDEVGAQMPALLLGVSAEFDAFEDENLSLSDLERPKQQFAPVRRFAGTRPSAVM